MLPGGERQTEALIRRLSGPQGPSQKVPKYPFYEFVTLEPVKALDKRDHVRYTII